VNYFEAAISTFLENWPPALHALSIPSIDVPVTLAESRQLGLGIMELGESFVEQTPAQEAQCERAAAWAHAKLLAVGGGPEPTGERPDYPVVEWRLPDLTLIRERVRAAVKQFPGGAFLRLGSRSPKDSWLGCSKGFKVMEDDADPLRFFCDCSERTADDLAAGLACGYPAHVWVREWRDFPKWAEFRCFMRGRQLVGISQYEHHDYYPEIGRREHLTRGCIQDWFLLEFLPACQFQDVTFDVYLDGAAVVLLEINPFPDGGLMTCPCLFEAGDFDGTFRFVREPSVKKSALAARDLE